MNSRRRLSRATLTFLVVSNHAFGDCLTDGVNLGSSSTTLDSNSDINLCIYNKTPKLV